MRVLIIDAQGGGIGRQLVTSVKKELPDVHVTAVGTNSTATAAMLKAGADAVATGENAVVVCVRDADIIMGPVGIVIADAMLGEVTPGMAVAVGGARATRILIPVNHCDSLVVGVPDLTVSKLISSAVEEVKKLAAKDGKVILL